MTVDPVLSNYVACVYLVQRSNVCTSYTYSEIGHTVLSKYKKKQFTLEKVKFGNMCVTC